ncbi:GNAT family N-acetyltransferase [Peribacillus sp. SCS-26]|uniref:GNAT family N-acetyltransferase n=1 Tax=Paraperibacillus marinus TaxID=3115295 RepID=UPI00390656FD
MNPILIEVPERLETERLLLRAPRQSGDGAAVNAAIRDSFHELKEWLPFAQTIPEVEETEINLRQAHIHFLKRESFRYLIFLKDTNEYIGTTGLQGIDWDIPKGEIGYWIHTQFGGRGYMKEAAEAVRDLGIKTLGFRRVEIRCEFTNHKSRAIPEKLGFSLEGILKNEDLSADGKRITDTCVYAVTN